jgi:hypothetical protein
MADNDGYVWLDADEIYTQTINTMLHLYALCWHEIEPWIHRDVFAAVNELRSGGWRHLGGNINGTGLPFAQECEFVQHLLDLLDGAAPDRLEKDAIARARYWLEPNPQLTPPPSARG